jgi:hypothetical protein
VTGFLDYMLQFILYADADFLLRLAQQFSPIAFPIVAAIGVTQGHIIGGAVVERFPRMLAHARLASILLCSVFAINAIASVINFAEPHKISIAGIIDSPTADELVSITMNIVGLHGGAVAMIAFSMTMLIVMLLKFTTIEPYSRAFLFVISVTMITITAVLRLSDYRPTTFEIILYTLYQAGVTAGILWGTRRRLASTSLRLRYFRERWIGKVDLH